MDPQKPYFSVIIPTYNRAGAIGSAVESVLTQTFQEFEIIVIDDGSEDDTHSVLKKFGDERIRYFWQEGSGCPASPRNAGIRKARGSWICFLDTDDSWYMEKLRLCRDLTEKNVDLIYHGLTIVGNRGFFTRRLIKSRQLKPSITTDLLMKGNAIATSSVVVRKSIVDKVGGFNESPEMAAAEDFNLWLKISEVTNQFVYLPKTLGEYLIDDGGISRKDMLSCHEKASEKFLKHLNERQLNKYSAQASYKRGRYRYTQGDFSGAKEYLTVSLFYGDAELRVKSAWMLIMSYYRAFKNL
jgi:glycosyltransferase involved in cell wall biosynthesis